MSFTEIQRHTTDVSQVLDTSRRLPTDARPLATTVEAVMSFEIPGLAERFMKDLGTTDTDASEARVAWLQFMVVCAVKTGTKTPSIAIDDMWHSALLFTHQYRELCLMLGRFIDHEPLVTEDPLAYVNYMDTREYARSIFGSLNQAFWPDSIDEACCQEGGSGGSRSRS